jgi:serine/threonine protein kinase
MLPRTGPVHLIDFGASAVMPHGQIIVEDGPLEHTPGYGAPERNLDDGHASHPCSHASDMYSVGKVCARVA